jgi:hypothetical protein
LLAFTGGGIFFFYQIGCVVALQERISLRACDLVRQEQLSACALACVCAADALRGPKTGVSAGALTATLAACDVDMAVRREPRSGWP